MCTDGGRGHSCCLLSHCDPRHWKRVPMRCSPALRASPDSPPVRDLCFFSVGVWLDWIQSLVSHTLHLEHDKRGMLVTKQTVQQLISVGYNVDSYWLFSAHEDHEAKWREYWQHRSVENCKKICYLSDWMCVFYESLHGDKKLSNIMKEFGKYKANTDKNWSNTTVSIWNRCWSPPSKWWNEI